LQCWKSESAYIIDLNTFLSWVVTLHIAKPAFPHNPFGRQSKSRAWHKLLSLIVSLANLTMAKQACKMLSKRTAASCCPREERGFSRAERLTRQPTWSGESLVKLAKGHQVCESVLTIRGWLKECNVTFTESRREVFHLPHGIIVNNDYYFWRNVRLYWHSVSFPYLFIQFQFCGPTFLGGLCLKGLYERSGLGTCSPICWINIPVIRNKTVTGISRARKCRNIVHNWQQIIRFSWSLRIKNGNSSWSLID